MSIFHEQAFIVLHGLNALHDADRTLLMGPSRGTYGGFEDAYSVEEMLSLSSGTSGTIKLAPQSHDPVLFARSVNALMQCGYSVKFADLNHDMRVTATPFRELLADGSRKNLDRCWRAGYTSRVLKESEWPQGHELVRWQRMQKGIEFSMTFAQWLEMRTLFPTRVWMMGTFADNGVLVAAGMLVAVRSDILYVYAWDGIHDANAPTVHLAGAIYGYAQEHKFRLLDAGTSTLNGSSEGKEGLIFFKEALGFLPCLKLTMRRNA